MATNWQTFPVEPRGGLVTNLSPLQHGVQAPTTARRLVNMEPSIEGGYRRIKGYEKFDTDQVPSFGDAVVQASGQTGTSLDVANLLVEPTTSDTFTIDGVTGTYSISNVVYSAANNSATLTISPTLASSPADQAAITFTDAGNNMQGVRRFGSDTVAARDGSIWTSSGSGWTKISKPNYGTVLVNGGAQSGTSLAVDGIGSDTYGPVSGDTFTVAGIEQVYTVTADASVSSGAATLSIAPALASSPADNAAVTWLSSDRGSMQRHSWTKINFNGTEKLIGVDGVSYPFAYDGTDFVTLNSLSDLQGAKFCSEFKDHLFVAQGDLLIGSAPFDETDWTPANGSASYRLPGDCTGLIEFRDQLIVFTDTTIKRLVGTSFADFQIVDITDDIGCIDGYTVQEIAGDIVFLGPDGIRFLTATDRIGDFSFQLASRQIQDTFTAFISNNESFASLVIREKDQYRIYGFKESNSASLSKGYVGVQFADQSGQGLAWAELSGVKAYVTDSEYVGTTEHIYFANADGYVYSLDSGNSFDGAEIGWSYYTPYFTMDDPQIRKTMYMLHTYTDPEGAVSGTANLKYDFSKKNTLQPAGVTFEDNSAFSLYGQAVYGTSTYGGTPEGFFNNQVIGSGVSVSVEYSGSDTNAPFAVDAVVLEFGYNERR